MLKCLIALISLLPAAVLAATVWTWVDDQGLRHYSDRQVPGATAMEVAGSQTFSGAALRLASPSPATSTTSATDSSAPTTVTYTVLDVISPAEQETFRNIAGNLTVELAIYPPLAAAHRIDVILDGTHVALGARSLEVTVPEVFRGQHTLQAVIVNEAGQELVRSKTVTFFVQQTGLQNRPAGRAP
jgi:hypothetical protein